MRPKAKNVPAATFIERMTDAVTAATDKAATVAAGALAAGSNRVARLRRAIEADTSKRQILRKASKRIEAHAAERRTRTRAVAEAVDIPLEKRGRRPTTSGVAARMKRSKSFLA